MSVIHSVNGTKKEINRIIHSVNGTKTDIGKIYHSVNGTKTLVYESRSWDVNFTCTDISSTGNRVITPVSGAAYANFPEVIVSPRESLGTSKNRTSLITIDTDFKLKPGDILTHRFSWEDNGVRENEDTVLADNALTVYFHNISGGNYITIGSFKLDLLINCGAGSRSQDSSNYTILGLDNDFPVYDKGVLQITVHNTVNGNYYGSDNYGMLMRLMVNGKFLY